MRSPPKKWFGQNVGEPHGLGNPVRGNHEECGSWKLENILGTLRLGD